MFSLKYLFSVVGVLIGVAFLTLLERKILSIVGYRLGPNKVSVGGLLQPISDAVKLCNKESVVLYNFSSLFYYVSCVLMLFFSLIIWIVFPYEPASVGLRMGLLVLMLVLGGNSLNSIICGWSSFSKYSLLGSMRTVSQLVSYEAPLYLCLFLYLLLFGSLSSSALKEVSFMALLVPFFFFLWVPCFLAELNRTPYDFSEGESELVSGFNTELGSNAFTLVFLSEYANIIFFCALSSMMFFINKFFFLFAGYLMVVLWARSLLPRYRFDKLMSLSWKFLVPFLTCLFMSHCVYN